MRAAPGRVRAAPERRRGGRDVGEGRAAVDHLATGAHPESQTRATKFNEVDGVGRSDAG